MFKESIPELITSQSNINNITDIMGCITSAPKQASEPSQPANTAAARKYETEYSVSTAINTKERDIAPPEGKTMSRPLSGSEHDISFQSEITCESDGTDFKSLAQGLQRKITILSQNSLAVTEHYDGDNEEDECDESQRVDITQIVATCREILELADRREQEISELADKRDDAEKRAIALMENNQKWQETVEKLKRHYKKAQVINKALTVKLELHTQKVQSTEQQLIEAKAEIVSKENIMEEMEGELSQFIDEKAEFEASMNEKLQTVEAKSKEKIKALQAMVKKNGKYLKETHGIIRKLKEEKKKMSSNCTNWRSLCQQQASIIEKLQKSRRCSSSSVEKLDDYLNEQKSLMISLESSMFQE